ncbi:MAG: asparagine--tRNA ligase [Spirochaetes bacterium]|nr:asparagine--tRNA ligase [Spirochaetota bacterium]
MKGPFIKDILKMNPDNKEISVCGWIRTKRDSKSFSFIELNDGSCMSNLQIIIDSSVKGYNEFINKLTTGSSVKIDGKLVKSPAKEQNVELHAENVTLYGEADPEKYVLQKKRHTFEYLRTIAHLRPRTNTFSAIARVRSAMSFYIHRFFQEKGFVYVHTPIITSSDCEGAGAMFQVTTLPLENIPKTNGKINFEEDFFGKKSSLTVSGQLEGETYACALGNIYTFGPTFRAEHSNTTRHLAEFWMIEPEMTFCDINGNMDAAEEFLKYIFKNLLENCREDMDFFNTRIDNTIIANLESIINEEFVRLKYTEAIKELEKSKVAFEFPVKWGIDLQSEHEKYLTEQVFKKPVILTDYPKEIKAFYMKLNEDDKTVRAMDVLVPRLGEIIGGSEREDNEQKLVKRIKQMNLNPEDYWWYLELRRYGSVPHSGFGLGFERLIQFVTGMQNIRDVIPFPRAFKSIDF